MLGDRLGRRLLREFATLVTPDTILRWHRELVARSGRTHVSTQDDRGCRKRFDGSSTDNPQWGYTRSQGALKNVGHRVAGSTIACILRASNKTPCSCGHNESIRHRGVSGYGHLAFSRCAVGSRRTPSFLFHHDDQKVEGRASLIERVPHGILSDEKKRIAGTTRMTSSHSAADHRFVYDGSHKNAFGFALRSLKLISIVPMTSA